MREILIYFKFDSAGFSLKLSIDFRYFKFKIICQSTFPTTTAHIVLEYFLLSNFFLKQQAFFNKVQI